eukprot:CAMPEP_0119303796 /NCGR_PEP_ID=MMETSP1333-20130426/5175_1 /TAXON_ID=418940 /ORGANISM="Scyphosphaera apsteinii, Strain RCC1455" /LENGTH=60 /DNA_ID=CAMNT_0007306557 /DNA_START=194 /DNA_END=376 /DNA_ORIENTATION=+
MIRAPPATIKKVGAAPKKRVLAMAVSSGANTWYTPTVELCVYLFAHVISVYVMQVANTTA